jgi:hypothetical protein
MAAGWRLPPRVRRAARAPASCWCCLRRATAWLLQLHAAALPSTTATHRGGEGGRHIAGGATHRAAGGSRSQEEQRSIFKGVEPTRFRWCPLQ